VSADLTQSARLLVGDFLATVRAPMLSRRFQQTVITAMGPVDVNVGAGTVFAYLEHSALTAAHLDRHRRHGYPAEHPADMLRVTYAYHGQREGYIFDWNALSSELTAAWFGDVRRYETGESYDPAFQGLETRAEPTEEATELIVEARKNA